MKTGKKFLGVLICLCICGSGALADVILFQNETYIGTEKYDGTVDSYPKENSDEANGSHNSYNTMYIRTTGGGIGISSLIKWADIQNYLRPGFVVQSARIGLTIQSSIHELDISIVQMLKPWNGSTLNWLVDGMGSSWAAAGAQGIDANGAIPPDRGATNMDMLTVSGTAAAGDVLWFDITPSVVQDWINDPNSNHGVVVYGSNSMQADWMIALSGVTEGLINGVNQRPILKIVGSVPFTFQRGTNVEGIAYTNCIDHFPNEADPNLVRGASTGYNTMYIRSAGANMMLESLVKWSDIESYLSDDFVVQSARIGLTIMVPVNKTEPLNISICELLRPWSGNGATWLVDGLGNNWDLPGAQGIPADRSATVMDTVSVLPTYQEGTVIWFDLAPEVVQGWIDNPSSNYGVLLYSSDTNNGQIAFYGTLDTAITKRPILEIIGADGFNFQSGTSVKGDAYTNCIDHFPNEADPNLVRGASTGYNTMYIRSAGANMMLESLIKWSDIEKYLSDNFLVGSARIGLTVMTPVNNVPLNISVCALSRPWSGSASWLVDGLGDNWDSPGAQGIPGDRSARIMDIVSVLPDYNEGTVIWFDLAPEVVQGWIGNPSSNCGVLLYSSDTNNGQMAFYGTVDAAVAKRPILEITGVDRDAQIWSLSQVQKINTVPSYSSDTFYQQGWQDGAYFSAITEVPVPLNVFWKWTNRSPYWSPFVLNSDNPLEDMGSMWNFGEDSRSFYDANSNIVVWYRRNFPLNFIDPSKKLFLEFSGVAAESEVFVNGTYVGRHNGSFTDFKIDITNAADLGNNLVALRCIIPLGSENLTEWANSTRYYAGIWHGTVELIEKDIDSIDYVLIDPNTVSHKVSYRVWLHDNASAALTFTANIINDSNDHVVVTSNGNISAGVKKPSPFSMDFFGELWSPNSPKLYRMQIILKRSGVVVDIKESTFGFRSVKLENNKFFLNSKPIQMLGYGEDGNFFGGEGYSSSQVKDRYKALIQAYKNTSATAVRWHNPCTKEQIDASDELGFLIYQGWSQSVPLAATMGLADYNDYLTEYVLQNYNHPSIIAWHFGNELWENSDVPFHDTYSYDFVRPLDTSGRPIVPDSGSYSFPQLSLPGISSSLDIVDMHNYTGVSFGVLGEPQRRPFTQTTKVMQEAMDRTCDIFGTSILPFMLGESPRNTVWQLCDANDANNWEPPDPCHGQGIYYRKPIGSDNLVRSEIFEEIKKYQQPKFGIGHGVKHEGFVNYIGNPGVDAGDLKSWTDIEVVKYCNEQYRLMPVVGVFINGGCPWTDILEDSFSGINRGKSIFGPILPIAGELPRQLFAGEEVSFNVSVDNKTMTDQPGLKLTACLIDANSHETIFQSAAVTVPTIDDCNHVDVMMSITPSTSFSGKAIVYLLVHTGDANTPVGENLYYVSVSSDCYESISQSESLAVWQPSNRNITATLDILDELQVNYDVVTTSEILTGISYDCLLVPPCTVFGPDMVDPDPNDVINLEWYSILASVSEDVNAGMHLLLLEQLGTGDLGLGRGMEYKHRPGNVTVDPTVWDHPVLTNVPWHKWWIWRGNDGDIAPYVFDIGLTTLATIGAHYDDELYSLFAEGILGNGLIILSQPDAVSRWGNDAAATLYLRELLNYFISTTPWSRSRQWTGYQIITPANNIDPSGADTLSYDSLSIYYQNTENGNELGAAPITSTSMEALNPDNFGVLDFESGNGWNQITNPINDDGASGKGSSFYSSADHYPYAATDRIPNSPIIIEGMITITIDTVHKDTLETGGWGTFLEYDNGLGLPEGYMVTSGNYGLATPHFQWDGQQFQQYGIKVTFSTPVLAAGVVQNYGYSYGRNAVVKWYDENGELLSTGNVGTGVGYSIFWGLRTDVPSIKSMWIGDDSEYPPVQTIDDLAFVVR
ncbi:MAG: hypothetical protein A2Y10_04040 [Planctomycetes bacterium GWF2_41_51]|nr:MAG: hypothetical protein A2Y10_04040 [Planctomycetes bacterium GWF2_41_51]HBG26183.1 hypothetical protein [Phycisphaerales bacterium]